MRHTFYYILHLPSGKTMPARYFGRGQTSRAFDNTPPRLFSRKQDAKVSLKCYLKGEHRADWVGVDQNWNLDYLIKPRPDRKAEEFIIKPIAINT